jgi:hypothetical protein
VLTDASGSITDGSWEGPYQTDSNCQWIVAPPGALQVSLTFEMLDVDDGYDFVTVYECYDMACDDTIELAALTGSLSADNLPTLTSMTGIMLVTFTTDDLEQWDGFFASWVSEAPVSGCML